MVFLSACATHQSEVFELQTGELITCQRYAQRDCGLNIMQCGEGQALEFDCLQDVHYVGKLGAVPTKKVKGVTK